MSYTDLAEYLDDDGLDVPIAGRVYRIPSPDHATGLKLTAMVNLGVSFAAGQELEAKDAAGLQLDDDDERDFMELVLGSAYPEMVAGGVSWVRLQRVSRYALLHFTLGPEAAADSIAKTPPLSPEAAAPGEAPAPNREARRASSRASSATATSSTRSRGSSAGTTSRPSRRKAT